MRNKALAVIFTVILTIQLSGCGLVLHPERKGQRGGNLDPAIAVLDAVGLLLFVVPGLIAFGVDLYYGTIYLPGTALNLDEDELNMLKDSDGEVNSEALAKFISDKIDKTIDANEMISLKVSSEDELSFLIDHTNEFGT